MSTPTFAAGPWAVDWNDFLVRAKSPHDGRMLTPRELYRLQGFPDAYIIEHGHDGRTFTKSQQVHMVGNSVSPPPAVALIAANAPQELQLLRRVA